MGAAGDQHVFAAGIGKDLSTRNRGDTNVLLDRWEVKIVTKRHF
jgi:hypothetical protein